MTIIRPKKHTQFRYILLILFTLLLGYGTFFIFEYSAIASKKHEVGQLKASVISLQTANADMKEEYYRLVDPANLEAVAVDSGMTIEKRPQYLTSNQ
ncbi:MAG: hypothetical protein WCW78_02970 [Candidatus Paceibacterota bacterium]|jgi:hypothetical protein